MEGKGKLILLVEDNKHLNAINKRAMELFGYDVMTALDLAEARKCLARGAPDAIVLDILLPDGNGVDFCREIRSRVSAPILFLTSVEGIERAIEGISAGGDDYLNKPYNLDMLIARIEAFWRRDEIAHRLRPVETIVRGTLTLDIVSTRAFEGGRDMGLTQKEFALLLVLAQNEGKYLSKEYLYEKVWKQPVTDNVHAVKTHLSQLRKKLTGHGYSISVSRGEGYMFEPAETE
jgi:DNA-binding response OmpR family regulator